MVVYGLPTLISIFNYIFDMMVRNREATILFEYIKKPEKEFNTK